MPRLFGDKDAVETLVQHQALEPSNGDVAILVPRVQRDRVAVLLRMTHDYDTVAKELGMTREQVESIDQEIRSTWNKRRLLERTERVDEELGWLERIRAIALDHYQRSRESQVESTRERKYEPPEILRVADLFGEESELSTGRGGRAAVKVVRKVSKRDGELGALRLAMDAGKEIRALLGIDAPEVKKLQLEGNVSVDVYDAGRLAHMGPAELAELHRYALEQSRPT